MNVDSDGDPQSYGPLNTIDIRPLDYLENAGWVGPDKAGADFKHRGNKQRKEAYNAGIVSARAEYEDLQKQWAALDPKKAALDPQKAAKDRDDLENKKIPAARLKIVSLNPYEFKPLPAGTKLWQQELWQPGDKDKPLNLGKIFWHWYGLQSMTPAKASATPQDPRTKKTPILYHPSFMKDPGPIHYEMYEDIYGRFPVVQQGDEPGPGYFVSTLATTVNSRFPEWDQRSTVPPSGRDVEPYGAVGAQLSREAKVNKRDTVLAIGCDTGVSLAFPFLDWGNGDAVAECSWTAFTALGGRFGKRPSGQLYKISEPRFLYLAFPNGQTPSTVLSEIGAFDNGDEFTMILAFLVQATLERSAMDPVQEYERRKKHPELNQNPTITNLATSIDTNLRPNGFTLH